MNTLLITADRVIAGPADRVTADGTPIGQLRRHPAHRINEAHIRTTVPSAAGTTSNRACPLASSNGQQTLAPQLYRPRRLPTAACAGGRAAESAQAVNPQARPVTTSPRSYSGATRRSGPPHWSRTRSGRHLAVPLLTCDCVRSSVWDVEEAFCPVEASRVARKLRGICKDAVELGAAGGQVLQAPGSDASLGH